MPFAASIATAHERGTSMLVVTAGDVVREWTQHRQRSNLVEQLKAAAPVAEAEDVTLILEPLK